MFWFLYLALPVYAGAQVAAHVAQTHGFLASAGALIAAMIAVLIPQTAFLIWLNGVLDRRAKANPAKEDPLAAAEDAIFQMPEKTGAHARFKQLVVYGKEDGRQAATRLIYDRLRKMITEHERVEEGHEDSGASMVSANESADGLDALQLAPDDVLVVFRSRDKAWVGFRCGSDSFRFRHRAVAEVICTVAYPAKGGGGYDISFEFRASPKGQVSNSSGASSLRGRIARYELPFGYDDRHARALTLAFAEIARILNAKSTPQQYADV